MIHKIIIYSNNVKELELIRSLSKMGINNVGLKVVNTLGLLDILQESKGVFIDKQLISQEEQILVVYNLLKNSSTIHVTNYDEVVELTKSLDRLSVLFTSIDLNEKDKQASESAGFALITDLYKEYIDTLVKANKMDLNMYIKYVIKECSGALDYLTIFEGDTQNALEKALIESAAKEIAKLSISNLIGKPDIDSKLDFKPCYGESNEVREIIDDIYQNNYPLDECAIYLTEYQTYINEFIELQKVYPDLKIHYSCGKPIRETHPYKLFDFIIHMGDKYLYGPEGYQALFAHPSFNKKGIDARIIPFLTDALGNLKINIEDPRDNTNKLEECLSSNYFNNNILKHAFSDNEQYHAIPLELKQCALDTLCTFVNDFSNGLAHIISKYSVTDDKDEQTKNDNEFALQTLLEKIAYADNYEGEFKKTYFESFNKLVLKEGLSQPGCLEVTTLTAVPSIYRPYVFIVGLGSKYFPGDPKQNFMVDDQAITTINATAPTSKTAIEDKVKAFDSFYAICRKVCSKVTLSYSFFSLLDVKECNPSSVIYDKVPCVDNYKKERDPKNISNCAISPMSKMTSNVIKGVKQNIETIDIKFDDVDKSIRELKVSPTDLYTYEECPRKFFYKKIMGLPDEPEKDIFSLLNYLDYGNLVHASMEYLKDHPNATKDEFLNNAKNILLDYFKYYYPISPIEDTLSEYLETMEKGYNFITKNHIQIIETEKYYLKDYIVPLGEDSKENFKLTIAGKLDALAVQNGNKIIIDYKTGKKIKHKTNDVKTCVQILTYQKLLMDNNIMVDDCVYFYPRRNIPVHADINKIGMDKLETIFQDLACSVADHIYVKGEGSDCGYCPFANICHKGKKGE